VRKLVLTIVVAFAFQPVVAGAQTIAITNIEIRMVKTSKRPPLRITVETRNPNDFSVRDVEVDCTIKDQTGKDVATYSATIQSVFQPNQRSTTRSINIGAWPEQGYAALCISKRGVRVTPPGAPPPPAPQAAPQTAPQAAPPTAPSAAAPGPSQAMPSQ
jgi:hypothetical protein